ncbi:hypothetical protein Ais01nite_49610 [Asanoa ishikariensis]|uniref:DUF3099 domain-containing protein n=1 Tax=Asanoa ishikariensis TaxID=137265 RepID=A0A1H3RSB8_9ACTN|nr:DUF3099 domain-containing protein [Asanoa ishikariensis]GIF66926.1 hypothetical protein Ais01nite_49610 [Asanoa ishikariensis]SDZ28138.1 Protein of unknown function [Asanoa ishikariensis]
MVKRSADRPVLITDAARSQDDQLRSRTRRYVLMMLIRAVCVVAFAVLITTRPPLLWLWLVLCGAGAVVIPWLAVILANDRPPKEKYRHLHKNKGADKSGPPSLPTQPMPDGSAPPHKTIDAEP